MSGMGEDWQRHLVPMGDESGRGLLPEPFAKALLNGCGIAVPRGVIISPGRIDTAMRASGDLSGPFALKGYGPGIVHKSDVKAVRLNVAAGDLPGLARCMDMELRDQHLAPAGFLIEEMQPQGVELLLGMVVTPAGIPLLTLGLGGVLAEALDAVVSTVLPLERDDAEQLLDEFPGARLLRESRLDPAADRESLLRAVLVLAGPNGLLVRLIGDGLIEFEINPLMVSAGGAVAADARCIFSAVPAAVPVPAFDFNRLFKPTSIAVAGASRKGGRSMANRSLATYRNWGWADNLYAIHPTEKEIQGVPAYPSVRDVPGGRVDYMKVAVPAAAVPELVRQSAGRVSVAQIVTGGFGELSEAGRVLEQEMLDAARAGGIRIVGPNCIGTYCPAGRQSFRGGAAGIQGSVGMVSQSGGVAGDFINIAEAEGLAFSKVVSVGNSIDVTVAEVLEELVSDPETSIIGLYLEGVRDGGRLLKALRAASGRKPIVALVGGLTKAGGIAAVSHTGRLTSDSRTWDAIARSSGLFRVDTLEGLLGILLMHQRYPERLPDEALLIMGSGGGATTLAGDAAERAGVALPQFTPSALDKLAAVPMGIPKNLLNPLEVVIVSPESVSHTAGQVLEQLQDVQFFSDVVVHANMAAYYAYGDKASGVAPLLELIAELAALAGRPWRMALVLKNPSVVPGPDMDVLRSHCREARLPLFPSIEAAMVGVAALQHYSKYRRKVNSAGPKKVAWSEI
jgi:acyl-CoA synthetase (NDP forming)